MFLYYHYLFKLNIRTFNDSDFIKVLELSIQFGNPYLFENVDEELDPIIYSVLSKNIITNNGQQQVRHFIFLNISDKIN